MSKEVIIRVENLKTAYEDRIIHDTLNFNIYTEEIFVILGSSGCGKSTLLRHIIGLNQPLSGHIYIDEDDIVSSNESIVRKALRKIGVLFQSGALIGSMTIADNVALPLLEYTSLPKRAIEHLVQMKLYMVGLEGFANHLPSEISGGMKKRAGLARALALNPKILFLDEPSAGLDPITSAEIDELILHLNATIHTTMVIVTHELASIFRIAQRVIMLDKSVRGIIAEGRPHDLKENSPHPYVRQFFNRTPHSH